MSTVTPSESSPPGGTRGKEADTHTVLEAPLTEPSDNQNKPSTSDTEIHNLQVTIREDDPKMVFVDKFHNLHKSPAQATDLSTGDLMAIRGYRQEQRRRLTFENVDEIKDDDHMERISIDAFMKGQSLRPIRIGWDNYLSEDSPEETTFAPIEIICGEPDAKTIQQPVPPENRDSIGYSTERFYVEQTPPATGNNKPDNQRPLPERIRIRSKPLVTIFDEIDARSRPGLRILDDPNFVIGSAVFLRPYQEFLHKECQLRDWLVMLERRFESRDKTKGSSNPSKQTRGDDQTGKECAEDTVKTRSRLSSVDFYQETPIDRNEVDKEGSVDSPGSPGANEPIDTGDQNGPNDSCTHRLSHSITALLHLRCLIQFIDKEIKPKQEYINSPRCTQIYFHDLWYLFKPGDEIIQQDGKQAFVVLRVQVPRHRIEEPYHLRRQDHADDIGNGNIRAKKSENDDSSFKIHCAYIDFDGESFGPVSKRFKISPFDDLKPIAALPVYPLRCSKETQARQDLINRGLRLLEVSGVKAMHYMGLTLDNRDEIDSEVVIDFREALVDAARRKVWEPTIGIPDTSGDRLGPRCNSKCCASQKVHDGSEIDSKMTEDYIKSLLPETSTGTQSLILQARSMEDVLDSSKKPTDTELLIMTHRVFGFVLRNRRWAQLDLGLLRHEKKSARNLTVDAFERLELPDNYREVLKSLIVQHFRSKQAALSKDDHPDLIKGKGKGLVVLLHGAPGMGKTTTAEGVAQLFRKPLFQITSGDLGTTAREVEAELEKNFALANRWGCILLLDEADVFLSSRERMDFKRNSLVVVFLRVLEYYPGILFLTTNRIGDFDEAFSSRIHMSLYYPPLDEEKTWKVFKLHLDLIQERFKAQGRTILCDESAIQLFASEHFRTHKYNRWNGRQIRNACQTALALADFDSQGGSLDIDGEIDKSAVVQLQLKYFETVQKAYLAFDEYLGDIQGTQGDTRAIDYKLRARTDTPYEQKRNAFSRHGVYKPARSQNNLYPEYPHAQRPYSNISGSNLGPQREYYNQAYAPAIPNADTARSHGYEPYSSDPGSMHSYQGQSRGGQMAVREIYDRPPEGSQQYPTNHRFSQGVQRGQRFGSPQVSNRIIPSAEDERYPSPSYDDSPRPYRGAQRQSQGYNYDNPDDGGFAQNPTAPTQGPSSYNPDPGFRPRRDDAGN